MKLSVKACSPETQKAHCAVIGVFEGRTVPDSAAHVDKAMNGALKKRLARGDISGKKNQVATIYEPAGLACDRLLVVGLGKRNKLEIKDFRNICRRAAEAIKGSNCRNVYLWLPEVEVRDADVEQTSRHLAEALLSAWYSFDELKSNNGPDKLPGRVTICVNDKRRLSKARAGVRTGQAIGNATAVARRLADLPGNICTPTYLAGEARKLQRSHKLKVTVLDEKEMKSLGMGALLSVAKGSRQPPKLIVMEYKGGKKSDA
ncbi:MAG TPA: M17 family peptidase N-terminal domain-containing protein, partial [Arenicellales bacterium]|nr:M17 family peptidase N-terminal domain-containing protein [Arenicellales bacterium]